MSTLPRRVLLSFLAVSVASCTMFAQTPPAPPKVHQRPIPPQPESVDQEQSLAYWTTETGWTSELQLRNNAVGQDLTVTPVLRLADGAETSLAPVTIKSQEVKSVDIGAAIAAASAPQLVGTYGSVLLRYRSPSLGSLYAALMVRSVGHPFAFHIDGKGELPDFQTGTREGIWWLTQGHHERLSHPYQPRQKPASARPVALRRQRQAGHAKGSPRSCPDRPLFDP